MIMSCASNTNLHAGNVRVCMHMLLTTSLGPTIRYALCVSGWWRSLPSSLNLSLRTRSPCPSLDGLPIKEIRMHGQEIIFGRNDTCALSKKLVFSNLQKCVIRSDVSLVILNMCLYNFPFRIMFDAELQPIISLLPGPKLNIQS